MTRAARVVSGVFGEDHEFWRSDTKRTFKAAAIALLANGFSEDDAIDLLGALWSATSSEYGA